MSTFTEIEKTARAQVGYHEGFANGHWNNDQKFSDELPGFDWSDGQAWCATFVSWVFWKSGHFDLLPTPSASCDVLASGFKKNGRWSEYPAKGAVVFYGSPSDLSHTGIVVDFDDDFIYAVEGNTNSDGSREGDGVYLKKRERRSTNLVGYGYPKYAEGIVSADPKYKAEKAPEPASEAPKPPKAPKPPRQPKAPENEVSLKAVIRASKVAGWAKRIGNTTVRADAQVVKDALKAEGVRSYAEWQREHNVLPVNGVPDMKSLTALGKRHKFKVIA